MSEFSADKLNDIFFRTRMEKINEIKSSNKKFVHYTTAEAAQSIIKNKEIWMRNAQVMNDVSEVRYGLGHVKNYFFEEVGTFEDIINNIGEDIYPEIKKAFNNQIADILFNTYIFSLSIHNNVDLTEDKKAIGHDEDKFGRLSMWRAYGGEIGVAMVFNAANILELEERPADIYGVVSQPVIYGGVERIIEEFKRFEARLADNMETLKALYKEDKHAFLLGIFVELTSYILCIKHIAFEEEQEWRVIDIPWIRSVQEGQGLPVTEEAIEVIRGLPQKIRKLPLLNDPDNNIHNMDVTQLLNKIIIGPTAYPYVLQDAFEGLLKEAGIMGEDKVHVSAIPLRT